MNSTIPMFQPVCCYHPGLDRRPRPLQTRLTEATAQAHCRRADSRQKGAWFDGYDYLKGCRP